MGTSIQWTDETWNPVTGCTKVSQGCKNCYADDVHTKRHIAFQEGKLQAIPQYAHPFSTIQLHPERLEDPAHWRRPRKIFVNSMSDLFHEGVPDEFIWRIFQNMTGSAKHHTFQILTKRPERMHQLLNQPKKCPEGWVTHNGNSPVAYGGDGIVLGGEWPLPNVWLGVTAENQKTFDERVKLLRGTPAIVRFLSCEPLLGPIDLKFPTIYESLQVSKPEITRQQIRAQSLNPEAICGHGIHWVICGGESGSDARPMHPDWARSLRDQCMRAGVPFFFKQWGQWSPVPPANIRNTEWGTLELDGKYTSHTTPAEYEATWSLVFKRSPKANGEELDGRLHQAFPEVLK